MKLVTTQLKNRVFVIIVPITMEFWDFPDRKIFSLEITIFMIVTEQPVTPPVKWIMTDFQLQLEKHVRIMPLDQEP